MLQYDLYLPARVEVVTLGFDAIASPTCSSFVINHPASRL